MTQANLRSSARPSYLHCRGNFSDYTSREPRKQTWSNRSVLMERFVVENRRGQADGFAVWCRIVADNPALAEDGAVLLAGDLPWHLKNHLHQCVIG